MFDNVIRLIRPRSGSAHYVQFFRPEVVQLEERCLLSQGCTGLEIDPGTDPESETIYIGPPLVIVDPGTSAGTDDSTDIDQEAPPSEEPGAAPDGEAGIEDDGTVDGGGIADDDVEDGDDPSSDANTDGEDIAPDPEGNGEPVADDPFLVTDDGCSFEVLDPVDLTAYEFSLADVIGGGPTIDQGEIGDALFLAPRAQFPQATAKLSNPSGSDADAAADLATTLADLTSTKAGVGSVEPAPASSASEESSDGDHRVELPAAKESDQTATDISSYLSNRDDHSDEDVETLLGIADPFNLPI